MSTPKIAVFASGNGSNFQAISAVLPISMVFSDQADAFVRERAKKAGVPDYHYRLGDFEDKVAYEKAILAKLHDHKIDWIVLAGYMKLVGPTLLAAYPGRIINIHPALLPAFPGAHGIEDAFDYGVKVTGVTVHYVDSGMDTGEIIAQEAIKVMPTDSLETLTQKIHQIEHELYPRVIKELIRK